METPPNQIPTPTQPSPQPVLPENQPIKQVKSALPKPAIYISIFLALVISYFVYNQYIWPAYFGSIHPEPLEEALRNLVNANQNSYSTPNFGLFEDRPTAIPPELMLITNLKYIDFGRGKIQSIPNGIGNLINLETLILSGNQIKSIPKGIGNLINLKTFMISDNQITSIPEEIGNLTSLEVLDLRGNKISSLPSSIANLQKLKKLDLGGNPIPLVQRETISSLLPNTKINY